MKETVYVCSFLYRDAGKRIEFCHLLSSNKDVTGTILDSFTPVALQRVKNVFPVLELWFKTSKSFFQTCKIWEIQRIKNGKKAEDGSKKKT